MANAVFDGSLAPAIDLLQKWGFRWWLSTEALPNIVLMFETPQVWIDRAPTPVELERFERLWDAGRIEEARALAQTGLPERER